MIDDPDRPDRRDRSARLGAAAEIELQVEVVVVAPVEPDQHFPAARFDSVVENQWPARFNQITLVERCSGIPKKFVSALTTSPRRFSPTRP